jgi:hypothetical protein
MVVQNHKYWFICYIDPKTSKPVIYKTSHSMQYQADAEARNLLGAKQIPFVVVGVDTLDNNAIQHIKAEALKLSGDLNYVGRSSHSVPAQPYDIIGNNTV